MFFMRVMILLLLLVLLPEPMNSIGMNKEMMHAHGIVTAAVPPLKQLNTFQDYVQSIDKVLNEYASTCNYYDCEAAALKVKYVLNDSLLHNKMQSGEFYGRLIPLIATFTKPSSGFIFIRLLQHVYTAVNLGTAGAREWLKNAMKQDPDIKYYSANILRSYSSCDDYNHYVQFLINAEVPLNTKDDCGQTALMRAVRSQSTKNVETLLAAGADTLIINYYGWSVLELAKDRDNKGKRHKYFSLLKKAILNQLAQYPDSYLRLLPPELRNEASLYWHIKEKRKKKAYSS